jgi:hypothetical protein
MVAPHSEQAGTCKRTSFQYKVIHIQQGDSYRTAAPQDGPWGYIQGRFTVDYRCLGWAYALSFSDCISQIKITICRQTTCIAVRVLTLSQLGRLEEPEANYLSANKHTDGAN